MSQKWMRPVLTAACHRSEISTWWNGRQRKGKGERVLSVLSQRAVKIARHSKLFQMEHDVRSISPPLLLVLQFFWWGIRISPQLFHAKCLTLFWRCFHCLILTLSLILIQNITSIDWSWALSLTMSLSGLAPSSVVKLLPVGRWQREQKKVVVVLVFVLVASLLRIEPLFAERGVVSWSGFVWNSISDVWESGK